MVTICHCGVLMGAAILFGIALCRAVSVDRESFWKHQ